MGRRKAFKHQFVELLPDKLEEGIVYISLIYGTVVHLCACGCENQVVTPLSPAQWKLTYDGEAVTLYPSIGNWSFSCQSHYWIEGDKVFWADSWSKKEIETARSRDRSHLEKYLKQKEVSDGNNLNSMPEEHKLEKRLWTRLWQKLKNLFCGY